MVTRKSNKSKSRSLIVFVPVCFVFIFTLFSVSSVTALPLSQLEESIKAAIFGNSDFSAQELKDMDLNKDGKVNVADLVRFTWLQSNSYPVDVKWYKWIIAASFISETSGNKSAPVVYFFGLQFDQGKATVIEIPGFDPTKGILKQDRATSGEISGSKRPAYTITNVIPKDTQFGVSGSEKRFTLTSSPVVIPKDDAKNPTGLEYQRSWTIEIDSDLLNSKNMQHGTVTEKTIGFVPGPGKTATGKIYMTTFSPKDLAAIETK